MSRRIALIVAGAAAGVLVIRVARHYHLDRCLLCDRRASHLDPDCDRQPELCPWCRGGSGAGQPAYDFSQGAAADDGIEPAGAVHDDPPGPAGTTADRSHLEPSILDAHELEERAPFLDWRARVEAGLDQEAVT